MKIKVIIENGIVVDVLADNIAENTNVEIVDYDKNCGDYKIYEKECNENGLSSILYSVNHCEEE